MQVMDGARAALRDPLTITPTARAGALRSELQRFELRAGTAAALSETPDRARDRSGLTNANARSWG